MSDPLAAQETVAGPLSRQERRGTTRYPCRARGNCQPVTANDVGNRWPVETIDISAGGLGLLLSRRFEPGTLLAVELRRPSRLSTFLPLARVCRVALAGSFWLLGCVWEGAVSAEDLQPLVGAAALWQAARMRFRRVLTVSRAALQEWCKTY